jgi:hypothetical protein
MGLSSPTNWKVAQGVDDQLAGWAKDPGREKKFSVQLCWAEAFSEASTADTARFLIRLDQSSSLDEAMKRLSELPFHVDFQADVAVLSEAPQSPSSEDPGTHGSGTDL